MVACGALLGRQMNARNRCPRGSLALALLALVAGPAAGQSTTHPGGAHSSAGLQKRAAASGPLTTTPPPPLNVLLILADDLGVDQVGSYARNYPCPQCVTPHADPCTPNLDALADGGVRFTNAWSSPLCTPSRAQLLTGKRASQLGLGVVIELGPPGMNPDETTIADLVPLNGAFGKWHLADVVQGWSHPLDCGFFPFLGTMWNLNPPPEDGPTYFDWRKYDGLNAPVQQMTYATTETTDDAIAWLNQLNTAAGPWFLYVSYHAPHAPRHCPAPPSPPNACSNDFWGSCPNCGYAQEVCETHAMTQALDHEVGRLLAQVDHTDTVVIFAGDNGTPQPAAHEPFPVSHAKATLYQGGINVPLIVSAPDAAPSEVHSLVHLSDVLATVTDLTQVPQPAGLDSVSMAQYFAPLHAAPAALPRRYVYSEKFAPNFTPVAGLPPSGYSADYHDRTLRNDRFKLIERNMPGSLGVHEFYCFYNGSVGAPPPPQDPAITPDPHEQQNLMSSMATWKPDIQANYDELVEELKSYPKLPLSSDP